MANKVNLGPVPYQTPVTSVQGLLTTPWQAWFRQIANLVLTASQIDATAAAAEAEAAATAAEAAEINAQSYAANALTSATNSASSATDAANSATAAAASAAAAAGATGTGSGFSPYYITSSITVPVNTQMVTFQRVTLAGSGRLQINGRGRIL